MLFQVNHRPPILTENLLPFLAVSPMASAHPSFPPFISPFLRYLCLAAPRSMLLTRYPCLNVRDQKQVKDFYLRWKLGREDVTSDHWHNDKTLTLLFSIKIIMIKCQDLYALCNRSSFPVWNLVSLPITCICSRFRLWVLEDSLSANFSAGTESAHYWNVL